jgi:hypothetical protein
MIWNITFPLFLLIIHVSISSGVAEIPKHAGPTDNSGKTLVFTGSTVRYEILGLLYKKALFDLQFSIIYFD